MAETGIFFNVGAGDGHILNSGTTWNGTQNALAGDVAFPTATAITASSQLVLGFPSKYTIQRIFLPVDLAGQPKGVRVNNAIYNLNVRAKVDTDGDADSFVVIVGETSQADNTTLVVADYDTCGTTASPNEYSSQLDIGSTIATGNNNIILNGSGIAVIEAAFQTQGYILMGMREGHDVNDAPIANNTTESVQIFSSENATNKPTLNIQGVYPQCV